tara:strand:- start:450 stop:995 length:546 start_codon:yes stop_codon:yes gene_type:complete
MSRLITNSIRSTSASADAITFDGSGNATFPANATCSGTATGFGGGKLLQAIQNTSTSNISTTTTITEIISLAITPSATTSKILINAFSSIACTPSNNAYVRVYLFRGTTSGTQLTTKFTGTNTDNNSDSANPAPSLIYLDSPNTTSATTYTFAFRTGSVGTSTVTAEGADPHLIILQEIGA